MKNRKMVFDKLVAQKKFSQISAPLRAEFGDPVVPKKVPFDEKKEATKKKGK